MSALKTTTAVDPGHELLASALRRLDAAAKAIGLDPGLHRFLAAAERTLIVSVPVQMAVVNNSTWITRIEPTSGRVLPNAPVVVKVTANNSGLAPRGYRDAIRITSSLGNIEVPVVLTVLPSGPVMTLSQNGLRFFARQGPASPDTLNVTVLNIGDPATPVVWRGFSRALP